MRLEQAFNAKNNMLKIILAFSFVLFLFGPNVGLAQQTRGNIDRDRKAPGRSAPADLPTPSNTEAWVFTVTPAPGDKEIVLECEQLDGTFLQVGACYGGGGCEIRIPRLAPADPTTGEPATTNNCVRIRTDLRRCNGCNINSEWEIRPRPGP